MQGKKFLFNTAEGMGRIFDLKFWSVVKCQFDLLDQTFTIQMKKIENGEEKNYIKVPRVEVWK